MESLPQNRLKQPDYFLFSYGSITPFHENHACRRNLKMSPSNQAFHRRSFFQRDEITFYRLKVEQFCNSILYYCKIWIFDWVKYIKATVKPQNSCDSWYFFALILLLKWRLSIFSNAWMPDLFICLQFNEGQSTLLSFCWLLLKDRWETEELWKKPYINF